MTKLYTIWVSHATSIGFHSIKKFAKSPMTPVKYKNILVCICSGIVKQQTNEGPRGARKIAEYRASRLFNHQRKLRSPAPKVYICNMTEIISKTGKLRCHSRFQHCVVGTNKELLVTPETVKSKHVVKASIDEILPDAVGVPVLGE
jgi:hypothetical protein